MKRLMQTFLPLALVAAATGCATPYMVDRGRDAADIFTATVGMGLGAKVQVGLINVGLLLNEDYYGLRGGAFGNQRGDLSPHGQRGSTSEEMYFLVGLINVYQSTIDTVSQRNKDFQNMLFCVEDVPASSTQLSVVIGALGSIRLGFNPGELLDFVLGWFGPDIYSDDLSKTKLDRYLDQKRKEQPYLTLEDRRRLRDARLKQKEESDQGLEGQ